MIVVDRIEGSRAVLELDGERVDVPVSILPPDTREGDILSLARDLAAIAAAAPPPAAPPKPRNPKGGRVIDL